MMYDHDQVVNANASEPPVAVACSFPLDQKWFPFELQTSSWAAGLRGQTC